MAVGALARTPIRRMPTSFRHRRTVANRALSRAC